MLRLIRVPAADISEEVVVALRGLNDLLNTMPLNSEQRNIVATVREQDGEFIFMTPLQGGVRYINLSPEEELMQDTIAGVRFKERCAELLSKPVSDPESPAAALLKLAVSYPVHIAMVDNEPVILPYFSADEYAAVKNRQTAALAAPVTAAKSRFPFWLLALLALLLAAGLLYFFMLGQNEDNTVTPQDTAPLAEESVAAEEPTEPEPVKLPSCTTVIKEGKLPHLFIAVDGSGSMVNVMPDGKIRMEAALQAVKILNENVDVSVPVDLIGIQGCPTATDYGTFIGDGRLKLLDTVRKTDPRNYVDFEYILTPLFSAVSLIEQKAPADTDAVGIIISDGRDTCVQEGSVNACALGEYVAQRKPKLKINIIFIGDPSELSELSCIAEKTGGAVYNPENSATLIEDIKKAGRTLQQVCTQE